MRAPGPACRLRKARTELWKQPGQLLTARPRQRIDPAAAAFARQRPQRPDNRGVGELAVAERQALSDENGGVGGARKGGQLADQPALADACFGADQDHRAGAFPRSVQRRLQRLQLLLASNESRA